MPSEKPQPRTSVRAEDQAELAIDEHPYLAATTVDEASRPPVAAAEPHTPTRPENAETRAVHLPTALPIHQHDVPPAPPDLFEARGSAPETDQHLAVHEHDDGTP